MRLEVKKSVNKTAASVILLLCAVVVCAVCSLLSAGGIILFPLLCAILGALLTVDPTPARALSIGAGCACIVSDVLFSALLWKSFYFPAITAAVAAVILFASVRLARRKSVCAAILTVILALAIILFILIFAFDQIGIVDFKGAVWYYKNILADTEHRMREVYQGMVGQDGLTAEDILLAEQTLSESVALISKMFVSAVLIIAFLLVGIMFKIFFAIMRLLCEENESFLLWRFVPGGALAIFYLAIFVLSMLVGYGDTVAVAIQNMSSIFTYVFAYIGLMLFYGLLRMRWANPVVAVVVIIILMMLLSSIAITALAVVGAITVIVVNKKNGSLPHENDEIN
ncbi:MAG: hypothetical protein IJX38_03580 [Clostridia bacterium]|nr:hypothetical protein [Clostridia bacterium]